MRPTATRATLAALTVPLLLTASACSKESDRAADRTTASASPSAGETSTATTGSPDPTGTGAYPAYAPQDYSYQLEVLCYCPQVGTVEVVVRDGEVTDATSLDGPTAGRPAPEFARLTIDEIIAMANDPQVAKARVEWPDGQDHPGSVMLDRIAQAVDDEVTYTIKAVEVVPAG
ncbi:hypothetical protein KVF89_05805 [Nocardioides carbamazepini]|uniref:DUF6174 domain-containing protein n=1 Tax=Nocardioides carbamazepini TaxID=2854259 RepID=UPI002149D47E|nr:DUF6174 domain-containing protein [Nocardioides carbamazepini]MCR1782042.1 hypothetical protein [Nocardioides carbamazepini]